MDSFKELTFFISYSAKRKHILTTIIADNAVDNITMDCDEHEEQLFERATRRQGLPTLSDTRWLSRVDSISTLLVQYSQIYRSLEEIAAKSTGQSKHDATAYMKRMGEFSYIMSAVMTQYILAHIRPLSVALQSKTCDLVAAHADCQDLISVMKKERTEETFRKLYDRATHILKETFGDDQEPEAPPFKCQTETTSTGLMPRPQPQRNHYRVNKLLYHFWTNVISHLEVRIPCRN